MVDDRKSAAVEGGDAMETFAGRNVGSPGNPVFIDVGRAGDNYYKYFTPSLALKGKTGIDPPGRGGATIMHKKVQGM